MLQRACYKTTQLKRVAIRRLSVLFVGTGLLLLFGTWFSRDTDHVVNIHPNRFKSSAAVRNPATSAQLHYADQHTPNQVTSIKTPSNRYTLSTQIKTANSDSRNTSYVLALGYTEQLSAATHVLVTLGALAADWGCWMVEPFVVKSFIFGFQNILPPNFAQVQSKQKIKLFDIYNATEFNKCFSEGVSPNVNMVDMETFLSDASRDVTVFHITSQRSDGIFSLDAHDTKLLGIETTGKTRPIECNSLKLPSFKKILERIETELNNVVEKSFTKSQSKQLSKAKFIVKHTFCLDQHTVYTSDMLQEYLPPETTVIFTNWRGCGLTNCFITNRTETNEQPPEWRDGIRNGIRTRTVVKSRLTDQFKLHHPSIESAARVYLDHLGYRHPFVSIHIRSERLLKSSKARNDTFGYIDVCLKGVLNILDNVLNNITRHQHHSGYISNTLLLSDTGPEYGTSTCHGKHCKQTDLRLPLRLKELGLSKQSFDPKVFSATQNSGYVSLVEMHMLAAGSKLVLVGFGGFQAILKNLFLSQGHHSEDVFHVCMDK